MEAFSLLKYWKSTSATRGGGVAPTLPLAASSTTTIVTAGEFDSNSDEEDSEGEGPFIDLEFAVPEEEEEEEEEGGRFEEDGVEFGEMVDDSDVEDDDVDDSDVEHDDDDDEDNDDDDREEDGDGDDDDENENADSNNVGGLSPSEEVLFNGQIVRISGENDEEAITSKSGQIRIPASLLRSATKFRVLMLKLKRSKSNSQTQNQTQQQPNNNNNNNNNNSRKLFTVKFKVEEVPVISLLSRASSNSKPTTTPTSTSSCETLTSDSGDEKQRNKKEVIQKYLNLVKPLYIRVSKRNNHPPTPPSNTAEKATDEPPPPPPTTTCSVSSAFAGSGQKVTSVVGLNLKGMIMAKKHLGKSKSAIVHSAMQRNNRSSNRRDDSLLEQQDGIQGAILHCKRSFNSSTRVSDSENKEESSVLTRSASDPSHEKKWTTATTGSELMKVKEEKTTSS